ncbi:mitochondrial ribonuclease P catalytic subunit [Leptopilina heterotoma]|uniref:mitochondrial ribonuclease P catalytic subunit n=1 Tax=Leptopilina heterotoma TaxID=63436 RepID=UPI001CA92F30|nr:mitochondrial ribonuclease P catalytic subunit [Leptopilina heterotoma]
MSFLTSRLIHNVKQSPALKNMSTVYTNFRIKKRPATVLIDDHEVKLNKKTAFLRDVLEKDLNVTKLIKSKVALTSNDWLKARDELMSITFINEKNIDAIVSNICFSFDNDNAFRSYVDYLKTNNYELNLYIMGTYASNLAFKGNLTKEEMQEIYNLYDTLRQKYSILDGNTCDCFVNALCATDRWEESIELLEMIYYTNKIPAKTTSTIIKTAFQNNKPEIGWKYLEQSADNKFYIFPEVYASYLEYCLKTFQDKELLEKNLLKILQFCHDKETKLHKLELDNYLTIFQSLGYTYYDTIINVHGTCMHCSHKLPSAVINQEEFKQMSGLFMKNVVIGDNVYEKTTPAEFKSFLLFLKNSLPYDIVIDGLNIALSTPNRENKMKAEAISNAVQYFVNKDKKVVLLGRKHMLRWSNMNYIKRNAKIFLMDNSSHDDPHLIYATLYGGMNTCFLSGDLMRQHKTLLPKNMQKLFKLWQLSHQYLKAPYSTNISYPVKYEAIAHEDENGWHVPYFLGDSIIPKDSYNATINWICLKKKV